EDYLERRRAGPVVHHPLFVRGLSQRAWFLRLRHATLESEQDQVGAAANPEFAEQIRDVELDGALGNVELAGDFLVRKVLQKRVEHFLFSAAEIGDRVGFQAPPLTGQDRVDKA